MHILVIGGTVFVGRHFVEAALARGHEVTLFNRGQKNPELFPDVKRVVGNRDGGLDALNGLTFDVVLDTCGYVPRVVKASASYLADRCDHYLFVSSISVYPDDSGIHTDESHRVSRLADPSVETVTGETYGPLKALCEQEVEAAFAGRATIVRPGLIVGPHDASDRFTYWPARLARGGEVLAPGNPAAAVQIIDVRDLGVWMVGLLEQRRTGIFNAGGPGNRLSMAETLSACREVCNPAATFTWVDDDTLVSAGVSPWVEMPLWIPGSEGHRLMTASLKKALDAGLTFRPLSDTIRDTLAWDQSRDLLLPRRAGLEEAKERQILAQFRALPQERA